jgi:hypothetical protein
VITAPTGATTYTATYAGSTPPCSDSFGYTCTEGTAGWSPASTLLNLTGDDAFTSVALPFRFPFYGGSYSTAWIDTNGVITFAAPNGSSWNAGAIPSAAQANTPNLALYPFWDDLWVDGSAGVYTSTSGTAPNRSYTVEWRNVRFFVSSTARVSFSATIKENGTIVYAYTGIDAVKLEKGGNATIGIENASGTVALQYLYRLPVLTSGRTVTFAPPSVPPPPPGGPVNVALGKATTADSSCNANEGPEKAVNGSVTGGTSDKWCSLGATKFWRVDLGSAFTISSITVRHAGAGGESTSWNTRDFNLQVSNDGTNWTTVSTATGNTASVTVHPITPTAARYVRLNIQTPTQTTDTAARIYEVEVYA